jgi:hypothetical protein
MPLLPEQTNETGDIEHKSNCDSCVKGQGVMPELGRGKGKSTFFGA